ncbi:MAG: substrate-binding domain-containing protein [Defluviitaleaceae bacterium]|nr:substrate-binding domain-containing protein [Defluviitaleaceae bacterium]
MKLKQTIAAVLIAAFVTLGLPPAATLRAASVTTTVEVDGFKITTEVVTESGKSLVPLSFFEKTVGAVTAYSARAKRISIRTAANSFVMMIGSKSYSFNGKQGAMAVAPKLIDGQPYVQMDTVLTAIGATINANVASGTFSIEYFTGMKGSVKITGSTTLQGFVTEAADFLNEMNPGLNVSVAGGGSGTGINDTINGTNNIGMSSSVLNDAQKKEIKHIIPVALDGIAIITHPSNPVNNLTAAQAAKIFKGEITNWKDVGGNNAPIIVQTRESGSGTLATFQELLMRPVYGRDNETVVATATPHVSAQLVMMAVAADANAIGFDSVGVLDDTVKVVTLNNVMPNFETVESGAYLLGRQLFVLSKGVPSGASAKFIDFLRAQECQQNFIINGGYLSIRKP